MQNLKFLVLLLVSFGFFSCSSSDKKEQKKKGYTITGFNYSDADSLYLLNSEFKIIKTLKLKKDNFSFSGLVKTADVSYLRFNSDDNYQPFILENQEYNVLLSDNNITIVANGIQKQLLNYQNAILKTARFKSTLHDAYNKRKLSLRNYLFKTDSIHKIEDDNFLKALKSNSDNLLSLYLIKQKELSSREINKIQELVKDSSNAKLKKYLSDLKDKTIVAEAVAKIENRPLAKEFSGTNLNGRITRLSRVKRGKKAILIDFWASWCGPCRELSPTIRNLYNKYKRKGFDIVTVSQDRSINDWEVGVYDDGMENWHHVYDDDNHIAKMYGVRGIPHMVLLDEKGRIIKNKIPVEQLKKELKKIFK